MYYILSFFILGIEITTYLENYGLIIKNIKKYYFLFYFLISSNFISYKENQLQNHMIDFLKLNIKLKSISLLRLFIDKPKNSEVEKR